jgi:hypothetical protein
LISSTDKVIPVILALLGLSPRHGGSGNSPH